MIRKLMDTLEWYSDASPQDRLEDGGTRALNLLMELNSRPDPDDSDDMLTVLLERVGAVLNGSHVDNDAINALRRSAMEWAE